MEKKMSRIVPNSKGIAVESKRKKYHTLKIAVALILLLIFGAVYQAIGAAVDRKTYLPIGDLYMVNKTKMHIYIESKQDSQATVVFAAGWGTASPYNDFYPLYQDMAKLASFAVYDKCGYGYSDITDKPREIDTIVGEIHSLLILSNQKPPYILVGHSMASLEVFRYAQIYPDEVKGIVLIDGGNPELYANTPPVTLIGSLQRGFINVGAVRLLYMLPGFADNLNSERNSLKLVPDNIRKLDKTATLLIANNRNILEEMRKSQENAEKVISAGKLNGISLTILTADGFGHEDVSWSKSQQALTQWSTDSRQLFIKDSMHYIHQYQPQAVISQIQEMINEIQD